MQHALSSSTDVDCNHDHDDVCESCDLLNDVLTNITSAVDSHPLPSWEVKDELNFVIETSRHDINAFKAHQLRYVNQEKARTDILDNLNKERILCTQDWAMKYLTRMYRESQSQWFGKRGISWHVTVATRFNDGNFENETLIHVFDTCAQDSRTVAAIMKHTVEVISSDCPEVTEIYYRSDNAACYHNSAILQSMPSICKRYDFSEPQGGKGACDRMAATVKAHISTYLNEGHDIDTAKAFKEAAESHGGIAGVKVFLCKAAEDALPPVRPIDKISQYSNFEFQENGDICAYKAYKIGEPMVISSPSRISVPSVTVHETNKYQESGFKPVKPRVQKLVEEKVTSTPQQEVVMEDSGVFTCPEEGCIKSFMRMHHLNNHLICGKHVKALDKYTFHDRAKLLYAEKLEAGERDIPVIKSSSVVPGDKHHIAEKGWALSTRKAPKRFNERQKAFLNAKFNDGERSGRKCDPSVVAEEMRKKKNEHGQRMFTVGEFLSSQQIAAYFSRQAAKSRVLNDDEGVEDVTKSIVSSIVESVGLQHPIISNSYNICELVHKNELKSLSMRVIKDMCIDLDIDTSSVKDKRKKAQYEKLLSGLVEQCTCKSAK